jgi:hypothetical protein
MICPTPNEPTLLLAMADMRGNVVAVAVLLAIGIAVLRLVNPAAGDSTPRRWLIVAAFVCGPISALVFFIADVFWVSPYDYYIVAQDYIDSIVPILIIGLIGGALGATAIWATECMSPRWRRHRARGSGRVADEQTHAPEPAAGPDSSGKSSPPAR